MQHTNSPLHNFCISACNVHHVLWESSCTSSKQHYSQAPWWSMQLVNHAKEHTFQAVPLACIAVHNMHDISRPLCVSIGNKAALSPAGACHLLGQQESTTQPAFFLEGNHWVQNSGVCYVCTVGNTLSLAGTRKTCSRRSRSRGTSHILVGLSACQST